MGKGLTLGWVLFVFGARGGWGGVDVGRRDGAGVGPVWFGLGMGVGELIFVVFCLQHLQTTTAFGYRWDRDKGFPFLYFEEKLVGEVFCVGID